MKQTKIKVALILVAVFVLLVGCGGENVSEQAVPTYTPYQTKDSGMPNWKSDSKTATKEKVEKAEEPEETMDPIDIVDGDLEKNFDEALKHVTICGKEVSFPLTLKELGKDFTFKKAKYQPEENYDMIGELYYKGEEVASIWIEDGRKEGKYKEKSISKFTVYSGIASDVKICGVDYNSPVETICDVFGEKEIENDAHGLLYWKNGKRKYARRICFGFIQQDCPTYLQISYKKGDK